MVSLCGLALSSLFVLNNKSVVHADTINDANSQNNAISWNSDSDTAQGVQNTQNTQKADDDQQNAAQPMQNSAEMSAVRSVSATPRTTNQNTVVQSAQPSRVETSTVCSSSATPRTTNQTAAVQFPRVSNVQDAQKASPVVINNPANDMIHVHYVDANGNAVDNSSHDYMIDAAKPGQGSYTVPSGYSLNNPDGKYIVYGAAFNANNLHASISPVASTYEQHLSTGSAVDDKILQDHGALDLGNGIEIDHLTAVTGSYTGPMRIVVTQITGTDTAYYKPDNQYSWSTMSEPTYSGLGMTAMAGSLGSTVGYENWSTDKVMSDSELDSMYSQGADKVVQYMSVQTKPGYTNQTLPVAFVDSNDNNVVGMIQNYSGKVGTTQNVSLTVPTGYKLADGASLPTSVTFANNTKPLLIKVAPNGQTNSVQNPKDNKIHVQFRDQSTGAVIGKGEDIDLSSLHDGVHYYSVPFGFASDTKGIYSTRNVIGEAKSCLFTDNYHIISGDTVTVPVHRTNRFTFSDNSGNVKSVNGNTVDVTLTKPRSVNPEADTRCQSQATRTIQINFPDGQIPQSYDGIVDKSGKLVQTVHFTRTATEDALTGNILHYGNWTSDNKDHNFIGFEARTLPRIPGYTLKISPVQA